ncbi:MAG TPA: tetratricopeptide repeat protein [Candidatus Binatia bacterium]|nr:tetratricopeptide repeat protein [Candidatus Binatia bacterium]
MPLLQEALRLPPEERESHLRAACNGDQELEHELLEALQWEERMGGFLMEPLMDVARLARPFEPGEVISGRFEIQREIGEGGMGVVYEAFDRILQQKIAVKAAKPGFQRLLSPELRAALQVRHRGVCLVKEIHTAQTDLGEIDFLAMEFLEGETLSAYLAEKGKLGQEEALEVACQLCAGLAEAHESGIIHRDLKSGNVILCHDGNGSRRAVITDFGLAGGLSPTSGELWGTPDYMAPELWRGEAASKASDIYALGVILYEMVAGRRPYEDEQPETGLQKMTTELPEARATVTHRPPVSLACVTEEEWQNPARTAPPAPPSHWTRDLDPRWDRAIMGCLELSPAERTQDVREVREELLRKRIPKWPFVSAATLIVVLTAVIGLVRPVRQRVVDAIWPPNVRLAVLPFNGPNDLAAIGGGALQEAAERIQQLPSERKWPLNRLSRSVAVVPPSRVAYLHVSTPQQARDLLHATHALKVSLEPEGGRLAAHASIIDLNSQLPVKELSVEYAPQELGTMSAALTHFVAMAFRLRESSSEDRLSTAASTPYLNGIYLLNRDVHSFDEAMAQFQQAARLDPQSALPPAGMALALVQKYIDTEQKIYLQQAREFVVMAQSRNPDSVRVLLASGRVNIATEQYNRALEDYRRIQELEPRNVDALLSLGEVYERLDEPQEAINAFHKAQELDPDYYRSYQLMGQFYGHRGRYSEAAEEFRKTVARAPGFFDGYSSLGAVLIELGDFKEAEDALQKSLQLRETPMALNNLGALMAFQKRYEEAAAYQKRALLYQPKNYTWMMNIADNLRWAGHKADALPYYRKAQELARADIISDPKSEDARAFFAYFSARLGDRTRAEEEIREAINLAPGDNGILRFAVRTYEALGERDAAIDSMRGMSLAELKRLKREPDLADFCQDPRFIQWTIDKGGQ